MQLSISSEKKSQEVNPIYQKIHIISLGCPKNTVDSEYIGGILSSAQFQLVEDIEQADIVIINTCSFIQEAVQESIDVILEAVRLKEEGSLKKVVVIGCLVQRYGYKLKKEIPEVDIWAGTGKFHQILEIIKGDKDFFISRPCFVQNRKLPRIQGTPFYTAYLKISDGCSHRCSYCLIPMLRGPMRSVLPQLLIDEARELSKKGVVELNLVAQDITCYGRDFGDGEICLEFLLERLLSIKDIKWIRLLYLHPLGISDRLLNLIENENSICPYLDIPIQHVNNEILASMRRGYDKSYLLDLFNRIKGLRRRIFLRTTLLVGFPGETDRAFQELYDFVKDVEFDHLGVFVFSPEKGTTAAKMSSQIEKSVANQRRDALMQLQAKISERKNKEMIGKVIPVLIEGTHPETELLLVGRSSGMAPEIDGQVIINKGYGIIGKIMPVLITDAHTYDLVGEIL